MDGSIRSKRNTKQATISRRAFCTFAFWPTLLLSLPACNRRLLNSDPLIDFSRRGSQTADIVYPNPLVLGDMDTEFLWTQIIDTVDDYFKIKTETRVRRNSEQWSEGFVETFPQTGATALEPWRKDSTAGFERIQSTLQTIRRTAMLRITPLNTGYQISIEVIKELEDVDRSQSSGEGASSVRHDGTILRIDEELRGLPVTIGWIRQENDTALEQRILGEIAGRTSNVSPPQNRLFEP